jgi:probable HAF family extracellular repeat protein
VGAFADASGVHGFLRNSNGTLTTIDDPFATRGTRALGINDAGQIVGDYQDASGEHGFLLSGGTFTTIDDPLATPPADPLALRGSEALGQ